MKDDKQDVIIPCFGQVRGCLVAHCTVASDCYEMTLHNEQAEGIKKYSNYPVLIGGTTTMGQISRSEVKAIFKNLETQPKRSLKK